MAYVRGRKNHNSGPSGIHELTFGTTLVTLNYSERPEAIFSFLDFYTQGGFLKYRPKKETSLDRALFENERSWKLPEETSFFYTKRLLAF